MKDQAPRKEIRHRTTLPQSNMQYHRRWAPYRSCSGWERELQACYGHREKYGIEKNCRKSKGQQLCFE